MSNSDPFPSRPAPPTGSVAVDAEHGIQLGLLEASLSALARGTESAVDLVDQLYTYSQAHFLSEQLLMRLAAQANYEGHVQEHENLLQQLDAVREKLDENEVIEAAQSLKTHEKDLLDHIRSWDRSVD